MSEVFIPPWIIPEGEIQEPLDDGSSVFRAAFAPGLAQRQSYGGLRLKLSRQHTSVRGEEKANLLAALRASRGSYNALRTKVHFARRGSFPSSELLTNTTFADGTTGWIAHAATTSISAADRMLRLTHAIVNAVNGGGFYNSSAATAVQYAPYVLRAMRIPGSISPLQGLGAGTAGIDFSYLPITTSSSGLTTAAFVPYGTSVYATFLDGVSSGILAGAYLSFPYVSMSRCALVDNGPNLLLRSQELGTSWTASNVTVNTNAFTAPDGTASADTITETTANGTHELNQSFTVSSDAEDYSFFVAVQPGLRSWCQLLLTESIATGTCGAFFNASTGAIGTTATGSNWANLRTFYAPLGAGWSMFGIVARKTNAATSIQARMLAATANGTNSYTGSTSGAALGLWRPTAARSSVPTRLIETTSVATSGASQVGSGMYVKGLPVSASGLLLPEDIFEVNGEIKTCTAPLNSDEVGLGYLQFEPPLVRSPSNDDPVIITDPMGKFLVSNIKIDNEFGMQARVSYDLEHIYE